jgi:O-antigen/teichoic acid export membrane protein
VNFTMHSFGLKVSECLSTSLDKVIVGAVFGFYALGIYQLGFQFVLFLSIIPLSLHSYLLPEEASGRVGKNVKFLGFLLAVIAAGLASSLAPYILEIFFRKFSEGADVVGVMCISIIPIAVTKILNASLLGRENSKKVLLGGLVYVLSLALGFVTLGTLLGIHGLAISVVLASAIQAGFLVLGVVSPQVGAGLASQRSKATTAKGLGEESW